MTDLDTGGSAPGDNPFLTCWTLTRVTAPWTAIYKYSPAQQSWSKTHISRQDGVPLSSRQQLPFEPPYFSGRSTLFDA